MLKRPKLLLINEDLGSELIFFPNYRLEFLHLGFDLKLFTWGSFSKIKHWFFFCHNPDSANSSKSAVKFDASLYSPSFFSKAAAYNSSIKVLISSFQVMVDNDKKKHFSFLLRGAWYLEKFQKTLTLLTYLDVRSLITSTWPVSLLLERSQSTASYCSMIFPKTISIFIFPSESWLVEMPECFLVNTDPGSQTHNSA